MRSTFHKNGTIVLSREQAELTEPDDDEVVVRIETTPVNSSDIGLLLGPADLSEMKKSAMKTVTY
ncbi:hypothetical protein [Pseudomonas serbica]|jgi:NADPH:quinone reductase-like Zn-dependent oxidoreductase|uniref:hypothetical protein n=1 Tax=Pseudomonas serbica TaxID=2965074 RepID=UPI0039E29C3E